MVLVYVSSHIFLWGAVTFMAFCRVDLSNKGNDSRIYRFAISALFTGAAAKLIAPWAWAHPIVLTDLGTAFGLASYLYATSRLREHVGTICTKPGGIVPPVRY